jgi:hypothetical protein
MPRIRRRVRGGLPHPIEASLANLGSRRTCGSDDLAPRATIPIVGGVGQRAAGRTKRARTACGETDL